MGLCINYFKSEEYNTALTKTLETEEKLINAGFEFVRYSDREEVAIYKKRK